MDIKKSPSTAKWGERRDLNPRPPGPQPGALPTELLPPQNVALSTIKYKPDASRFSSLVILDK